MKHMQHIAELAPLFEYHGIRHVVISPGSRNAPLMQLFTSLSAFRCHSIVDERSAGYVALGMARELNGPVALLCTSGTAVLNLAPAVAEAWHQRLPLVVLTTDRPRERFDCFNNQWLDQQAPYGSHVKQVLQWPTGFGSEDDMLNMLERADRLLQDSGDHPRGPVHMNFLLEEPLYARLPANKGLWKQVRSAGEEIGEETGEEIGEEIGEEAGEEIGEEALLSAGNLPAAGEKLMVLAGAGSGNIEIRTVLVELVREKDTVVVAENISNLDHSSFISNPELVLASAEKEELEKMRPQRILSFGGQVVSKRLRLFLQGLEDVEYSKIPPGRELAYFKQLADHPEGKGDASFLKAWKDVKGRALTAASQRFRDLPFSNLAAVHRILDAVPGNTEIHLGNSAAIRFSQIVPLRSGLRYRSNRGTSGIDGCVSSAVGAAMVSQKDHLLMVGDLSFVYDSNALWNKDFPSNLKIAVLNDRGGGIFRLLDGPSKMPFSGEFQVTSHPANLEKLCATFGIGCLEAGSEEELEEKLEFFFSRRSEPIVLEVDTSGSENNRIFKDFFRNK